MSQVYVFAVSAICFRSCGTLLCHSIHSTLKSKRWLCGSHSFGDRLLWSDIVYTESYVIISISCCLTAFTLRFPALAIMRRSSTLVNVLYVHVVPMYGYVCISLQNTGCMLYSCIYYAVNFSDALQSCVPDQLPFLLVSFFLRLSWILSLWLLTSLRVYLHCCSSLQSLKKAVFLFLCWQCKLIKKLYFRSLLEKLKIACTNMTYLQA